jgi:Domain of unknown function (DUF4150)/GHH signature containing HNH/Endo VII superfamily nuclease toxin  2
VSNQVYANNMEVSCKQAAGKSICAFPDVCMTPPMTPATPPGVPIPYPNTGMASDTTDGSSSVKISGQEVMLKNKSYFKKSMGDEAGCAPKKGVLTSKNMGKVYFNMWSMDLKVEGENVVRNLDITTHNHASYPTNSPTWPYLDKAQFDSGGVCDGVDEKYGLQPHSRSDCPKGHSAHHVIPNRQFSGAENYTRGSAPCICAEGLNQHALEHGEYHEIVDASEITAFKLGTDYSYAESRESTLESIVVVNELDGDSGEKVAACVEAQLDNYYKKRCGVDDDDAVKSSGASGKNTKLYNSSMEECGT